MPREIFILFLLIVFISPSLGEVESDIQLSKDSTNGDIHLSFGMSNLGSGGVSPTFKINAPEGVSVNSEGVGVNSNWVDQENKWVLKDLMPGARGIGEATLVPDKISDGEHSVEIFIDFESETREIPVQFNVKEGEINDIERESISKKFDLDNQDVEEGNQDVEDNERVKVGQEQSRKSSDADESKEKTSKPQNEGNNDLESQKYSSYSIDGNKGENKEVNGESSKDKDEKESGTFFALLRKILPLVGPSEDSERGNLQNVATYNSSGGEMNLTEHSGFKEISSLEFINNSAYYISSKEGKTEDKLYRDGEVVESATGIRSLVEIDGKPGYIKVTGNRRSATAHVIVGGEEVNSFDALKSSIEDFRGMNGKAVYRVVKRENTRSEGLEGIYVGSEKKDEMSHAIRHDLLIEHEGSPALVTYRNGDINDKVLVETSKNSYGPYEDIKSLESVGDKICYIEMGEGSQRVYCDGDLVSSHGEIKQLQDLDGKPVYIVDEDGESFVEVNGRKIGESYIDITELETNEGNLAFAAVTNDDEAVLGDSDGVVEKFDAIDDIKYSDAGLVASVRDGGEWKIYHDGENYGSYPVIRDLKTAAGQVFYVVDNGDSEVVYRSGEPVASTKRFIDNLAVSESGKVSFRVKSTSYTNVNVNGEKGPKLSPIEEFDKVKSVEGKPVYTARLLDNQDEKSLFHGKTLIERDVESFKVVDDEIVYKKSSETLEPGTRVPDETGERIVWSDRFVSPEFDDVTVNSRYHEGANIINGHIYYVISGNDIERVFRDEDSYSLNSFGDIKGIKEINGKAGYIGVGKCETSCDGPGYLKIGTKTIYVADEAGYSTSYYGFSGGVSQNAEVENKEELPVESGHIFEYGVHNLFDTQDGFGVRLYQAYRHNSSYNGVKESVVEFVKTGKDTYRAEKQSFGKTLEKDSNNRVTITEGYWGVRGGMKDIGGDLFVIANGEGRDAAVYAGEVGREYEDIERSYSINEKPLYIASKSNEDEEDTKVIVFDGEKLGEYDSIGSVIETSEGPVYKAKKDGKASIYYPDGSSEEYDKITNLIEVDGEPAFVAKENGETRLIWDGDLVHSAKSIDSLTSLNSKPLSFSIRERKFFLENETIGTLDSMRLGDSEVKTGNGFISVARKTYPDRENQDYTDSVVFS